MTRLLSVLAAALTVPAIAFAQQGGPTVYGIVDASARHASGLTAANAPAAASVNGVASGVNNTSRIGFRGREDLGNGMYALFNLETGLSADTGATANATKFFDRAAIVGLGGALGQVTMGRQTNLLADAVSPVDPVGMRFAAFNPNIVTAALSNHGLGVEYGATGSSSGSYRLDNSLKYTGAFGPVTARAMYGMGENTGSTAAQHSAGAGLAYAAGGGHIGGLPALHHGGRPAAARCHAGRGLPVRQSATCHQHCPQRGADIGHGPRRAAHSFGRGHLVGHEHRRAYGGVVPSRTRAHRGQGRRVQPDHAVCRIQAFTPHQALRRAGPYPLECGLPGRHRQASRHRYQQRHRAFVLIGAEVQSGRLGCCVGLAMPCPGIALRHEKDLSGRCKSRGRGHGRHHAGWQGRR